MNQPCVYAIFLKQQFYNRCGKKWRGFFGLSPIRKYKIFWSDFSIIWLSELQFCLSFRLRVVLIYIDSSKYLLWASYCIHSVISLAEQYLCYCHFSLLELNTLWPHNNKWNYNGAIYPSHGRQLRWIVVLICIRFGLNEKDFYGIVFWTKPVYSYLLG